MDTRGVPPACTAWWCGHMQAQEVYLLHALHGGVDTWTQEVYLLHALHGGVDTCRHKRCTPCMHCMVVWTHAGTRGVPPALYSPTTIMATHSGTNISLQTLRPLPAAVRGGREGTGQECMLCAAAKFPNLACSVLTISCGLPSICGATSHVLLWGGGGEGGGEGSGEDRTALLCNAHQPKPPK